MISRTEDDAFIREVIRVAESAMAHGNHPFGALLVSRGELLLTAENAVITEKDVTCHAELSLVRQASQLLDERTIQEATLYASTEPCVMCSGAIYWLGVRRVVFACSAEKLGEIAKSPFVVPCREIFNRAVDKTEVIGPLLEQEAAKLHEIFWRG